MFIDAITPQVNIINLFGDLDEGFFTLLSESEIEVAGFVIQSCSYYFTFTFQGCSDCPPHHKQLYEHV